MRLIGSFETERQAYVFYSFLTKEGVENIYEPYFDQESGKKLFRIWVQNEDDLDHAMQWLRQYKENPNDVHFQHVELPLTTPSAKLDPEELEEQRINILLKKRPLNTFFTTFIIVICSFVFLWNDNQEEKIKEEKGEIGMLLSFTPIFKSLLFDFPDAFKYREELVANFPLKEYKEFTELPADAQILLKKAEDAPFWKGLFNFFLTVKKQGWATAKTVPMFEKIQQGEFWRLFTPCLLHGGFLHILFNMVWVWLLGRQIEERISKWKMVLMIVIIGVVANIAQYLAGGPLFMGFSGVAIGMAGFIWVRQKIAPWEGYPLQKATLLFLLFFILSMVALEAITFSLQMLSVLQLTPTIANTAHIVGGLTGMLLGKLSLFNRRAP